MKRGHKIFIVITLVLLGAAFFMGRSDKFGPDRSDEDTIALLRIEGPIIDVRWYLEQVRELKEDEAIKVILEL